MTTNTNKPAVLCYAVLIGLLAGMFFAKALPQMHNDTAAQEERYGLY